MIRGLAGVLALGMVGCAAAPVSTRALHYVDGELVHSRPPPAAAYEAYLRARLALEHEPPHVDAAREQIDVALRFEPKDPQLWTTRAEIEAAAGDDAAALAAAQRALAYDPEYTPARALLVKLGGAKASAAIDTSR